MKIHRNSCWFIEENEENYLLRLRNTNDEMNMNWAEGEHGWGRMILPEGLTGNCCRVLSEDDMVENYTIRNDTDFPIFPQMEQVGIYITFNDNYTSAKECLERRCNTHIFIGGTASWVMALRMGGRGPHLGMQVLKGGIVGYSVVRGEKPTGEVVSNDRGDFLFHPELPALSPGEEYEISFRYFWFDHREDFWKKLLQQPDFPVVRTENCTFLPGEQIDFDIWIRSERCRGNLEIVSEDKEIRLYVEKEEVQEPLQEGHSRNDGEKLYCYHVCAMCSTSGEKRLKIQGSGNTGDQKISTWIRLYISLSAAELLAKRCEFIARRQQYHGTDRQLRGAYLIYDNEIGRLYYDHVRHDHNAARERVGMGALIALFLQTEYCREDADDSQRARFLYESLMEYTTFIYREIYDESTGVVANDIGRNLDWNRLYNYPWVSVFLMEMGKLTEDSKYIKDAVKALLAYYRAGGENFYAIGIPMKELIQLLNKLGLHEEKESILPCFRRHLEKLMDNGVSYPASEVAFEQSIVAPAVLYLIEGYALFGEQRYLEEAARQMKVLRAFNGQQPDYHQFENAIRHWDGYWFGKNHLLGDTYPHYWSVLSGIVELEYGECTGNKEFLQWGEASLRGCLNLFHTDGSASCAMIYPATVNGEKANCYDPWGNDQDWALYYWMKYHMTNSNPL